MICLFFGGLDLIFKVIVEGGISFEPVDGFSSHLQSYIIQASLRAGLFLVALTSFSGSQSCK